jgi:antitoxin HicB
MRYFYRLIEEDGAFTVEFPDLPQIITYGHTEDEARFNAEEALNGALASDVARGFLPPDPVYKEGYPVDVAPHIQVAIQLRRLRGNTSQSDIASRLGIAYQSYQKLENPVKGNPTIKTLDRVAKVMGKRLEVEIV